MKTKKKLPPRRANAQDKIIGEAIRTQRLIKGLSQSELGKLLGVSFQQVQKYEKGVNRVSSARIREISEALDVHIMTLLGAANGERCAQSTPFSRFVASKEGVKLIEAMLNIEESEIRHSLISLAETLHS